MKKFIACALMALSFNTFATVDGFTTVAIVSFDYNSEEFMVTRAPVVGCYGLPRGPQLVLNTTRRRTLAAAVLLPLKTSTL
jgi:hypothetical protein